MEKYGDELFIYTIALQEDKDRKQVEDRQKIDRMKSRVRNQMSKKNKAR
jgi:hypothetical protein